MKIIHTIQRIKSGEAQQVRDERIKILFEDTKDVYGRPIVLVSEKKKNSKNTGYTPYTLEFSHKKHETS